ncbi:MAG TPA: hypothetical protein VGJ82_07080, partial [Thermoanaerobaculia bacterium]
MIAPALILAATLFSIGNDGKSWVGFHLEDTLEEIDADTKKVSGAVDADPANLSTASVTLSVDTASLDSGMKLR